MALLRLLRGCASFIEHAVRPGRAARTGLGTRLVTLWESEMREAGYDTTMTPTLSHEDARHFYRKLGYEDRGCLLLPGESLEILFVKPLT